MVEANTLKHLRRVDRQTTPMTLHTPPTTNLSLRIEATIEDKEEGDDNSDAEEDTVEA